MSFSPWRVHAQRNKIRNALAQKLSNLWATKIETYCTMQSMIAKDFVYIATAHAFYNVIGSALCSCLSILTFGVTQCDSTTGTRHRFYDFLSP